MWVLLTLKLEVSAQPDTTGVVHLLSSLKDILSCQALGTEQHESDGRGETQCSILLQTHLHGGLTHHIYWWYFSSKMLILQVCYYWVDYYATYKTPDLCGCLTARLNYLTSSFLKVFRNIILSPNFSAGELKRLSATNSFSTLEKINLACLTFLDAKTKFVPLELLKPLEKRGFENIQRAGGRREERVTRTTLLLEAWDVYSKEVSSFPWLLKCIESSGEFCCGHIPAFAIYVYKCTPICMPAHTHTHTLMHTLKSPHTHAGHMHKSSRFWRMDYTVND